MGFCCADVDDNLAILLALRAGLDVNLITLVSGNVRASEAYKSISTFLALTEYREIPPIAIGSEMTLSGPIETGQECIKRFFREAGMGYPEVPEISEPNPLVPTLPIAAPLALIEAVRQARAEKIIILALGPLTNIALAILLDPKTMRKVSQIVAMGGVFDDLSSLMPPTEFNIRRDPEAAVVVFNSKIPLTLVPLNVTTKVRYSFSEIKDIFAEPSPLNNFILTWCEHWAKICEQVFGFDYIVLHDPVAVGYVLRPDLYTVKHVWLEVELYGSLTRGKTLILPYEKQVKNETATKVCTDVNVLAFKKYFADLMSLRFKSGNMTEI